MKVTWKLLPYWLIMVQKWLVKIRKVTPHFMQLHPMGRLTLWNTFLTWGWRYVVTCFLWLPCFSIFGDIFLFLKDSATDIGTASKENSSHFLHPFVFHVVNWLKSQETFWDKKMSGMDSKFQATLLKKWGYIRCSCRGRWNDEIMKLCFSQHSLWYNEWLFSTYTLLNSSSGCVSSGTCISCVADGGKGKDYFHSRKEIFQGTDFSSLV